MELTGGYWPPPPPVSPGRPADVAGPPPTPPSWRPANDVERGLRDAVHRSDQDAYRAILGTATLVLPLPPGTGRDSRTAPPWPTGRADGRTFVVAFTSPEALRSAVGSDTSSFRPVPFADVADRWPDPSVWLAVNLGTPVQALLDSAVVAATATRAEREIYPVDLALRAAVRLGDETAYVLALLATDLVLPLAPGASSALGPGDPDFAWVRSHTVDGQPVIVAYTSRQRVRCDLGADVAHLVVDLAELLARWPDRSVALAVNPGTPIAGLISGSAVIGLSDWLTRTASTAAAAAAGAGEDIGLGEQERELAAYASARAAVAAALRDQPA